MPNNTEGLELARQLLNIASGCLPEPGDLDGAVVRSLLLLTLGKTTDFCKYADPPAEIASWLVAADMENVRGLLMATLRRWHELQQAEAAAAKSASRDASQD